MGYIYEPAPDTEFLKCCSKCNYLLPLICFYPDKSKPDGHASQCRSCKLAGGKTQHRLSNSPTYETWASMLGRCRDKKSVNYGGRGISVCERWLRFENFLRDMGRRPDGMTLDRIDVNGNYCKENCRWATDEVQFNNKRNTRRITIGGETKSLTQWARQYGLDPNTVRERICRGVDVRIAIFTPRVRNARRSPLFKAPSFPFPMP